MRVSSNREGWREHLGKIKSLIVNKYATVYAQEGLKYHIKYINTS